MLARAAALAFMLAAPAAAQHGTWSAYLSADDALRIGRLIWNNECRGSLEGLTHWNEGEAFASLGIGHFIWYPAGAKGPFVESFLDLVDYLKAEGLPVPAWLEGRPPCPWRTRRHFIRERHSRRMLQLRRLLARSVALQTRFMIRRLERALPAMLAHAGPEQGARVQAQFDRLAAQPSGLYAMVDYVNFKGEGLAAEERYAGLGWGLLQALEGMSGSEPGAAALEEFARSAEATLERRIANSPPQNGEARWARNWKSRVATYRRAEL